jgi:hypothetical protein
MPPTSEQLWDAIGRLAHEDGTADRIFPSVVAKLIEFKMVTLDKSGLPQLTEYGHKCYGIFESGDDSMTEIDDLAFVEHQQRQGDSQRVE